MAHNRLGALISLVLAIVVELALHSGHASVTRIGGLLVTYGTLVTGLYGLGFATLLNEQSAYRGFLDALPVGRLRRALDMIIAVEAPAVALVLLLGTSTVGLNSGAAPVLVALCATLALCIAQYLIHTHLPRHAIAAGLSTAIAGACRLATGALWVGESRMNAIISLDRMTISFRRQLIFDSLSHVFEHGCHLLLGQNGTGKSTLLGTIAGSVR